MPTHSLSTPTHLPGETQCRDATHVGLRRELLSLLDRSALDGARLDSGLRALANKYQCDVYDGLIQLLTSLELDQDEGSASWRAVVAHQQRMERDRGRATDIRVAMLDWFLETRALKEPRIVELDELEELQASVYRDGLTDLHNYRFFDEHLRREIAKGGRRLTPLSLVMIDVDDFKAYNDRYGHEAGNQALIAVARVLGESLRQDDVCARYGGEEFALVLSDTPKPAARDVAERTRRRVQEVCAELAGVAKGDTPTISLGIATHPADATDANTLIRSADKALYAAKDAGKNQVRVFGDVKRSYRRAEVLLDGRFRTLETRHEPFNTSSIGEGGLRIRVGRELPVGSLLEIRLQVPGHGHDLAATGRVVYLRPDGPEDFEAGIRITEITAKDRMELGRLLERSGDALEAGD